jgi:Ca2+:H+ antiporter
MQLIEKAAHQPSWAWASPVAAMLILVASWFFGTGGLLGAIAGIALFATVFAAVHHAEVVAHRIGEPFGTLVLALAVTVIETALIVSVMLAAPAANAALARDTIFAAVMIVCNGIVGACLLAGGARHYEQAFRLEGANAAMAVLTVLTVLTLIFPNFSVSSPGPSLSRPQLIFEAAVSLALYGSFIFTQTVRHRDYFLADKDEGSDDAHIPPVPTSMALVSAGLLVVALLAIVGLAKMLTPAVEAGVSHLGMPRAVVGIIIAALVLMPEGLAAVRAAQSNRLQTSLNLALGSALATIGLTIPAVAFVSIGLGQPLELGLDPKEEVLLALTLLVSVITLGTGRTTILEGTVHLLIFAVFLFFAAAP